MKIFSIGTIPEGHNAEDEFLNKLFQAAIGYSEIVKGNFKITLWRFSHLHTRHLFA